MKISEYIKKVSGKMINDGFVPSRRRFGKTAFAGVLGGKALVSFAGDSSAIVHPNTPGIKLAAQLSGNPNEDDFTLVKQLGVKDICIWTVRGEEATYENYLRLRKLVESHGLTLWNIINLDVHGMEEVILNLPGRDKKIEEYKTHIRNLGKAGVYYTTYTHVANGIWSTETEYTRGARARAFDLSKAKICRWKGQTWELPLTHGRVFTEEEIWDNYIYFIKKIVPVAEDAGVKIGFHPDDPPLPEIGGIPRCILGNFEGFKRAMEIADSPNIGVCFCVGCWLEGGDLMGKDILEAIHYFSERKKLFKVHFRNVDQPLPHFKETFMDNGYYDMYKVMKTLREVDFDGIAILDHSPGFIGGGRVNLAYGIAYMRALMERANDEIGG
ncbi:mannonate dehydratase [Candidatus Latescibacterota bacterium]